MSADLVAADWIPTKISLPAEYTDAVIEIRIVVEADGRVTAPSLEQVQAALARGSVEMVRQYCGLWTRWLARAVQQQQAATS